MDFRYLVETKNEFNNFLCGILIPHIFHGIKGMFKYSENVYDQIEQKNKKGSRINNPGILHIFKKTLEGITGLNNHEIEEEYFRIKNNSGHAEWFDNLVKASFKSYVLFLTWDPKISNSKYGENSIYDNISIKDFIHKCYITSCDYFRENPELFINEKMNKKDIFDIIKNCIELAIRKVLPFNQIINEYLQIEFNKKDENTSKEIADIKKMVSNIINNKKYGVRPNIKNIIKEDSEEYMDIENSTFKKIELEEFINVNSKNKNDQEQILNNNLNKKINDLKLINSEENISLTSDDKDSNLSSEKKIINSEENINLNNKIGGNKETSTLTRNKIKNREFNEIMELRNSSTSESNNSKLSKNSKYEILTSPPRIKVKANERLEDELKIGNNIFKNKNIKVIMNKKNEFSDKFEELESYYDSMIK